MTPAYTHGHAESVLRSHPTRNSADLAELIAPGRLVALETSEEILALTRAEVESRGCDNVDYLVGDVHALDLVPGKRRPRPLVRAEPGSRLRQLRLAGCRTAGSACGTARS